MLQQLQPLVRKAPYTTADKNARPKKARGQAPAPAPMVARASRVAAARELRTTEEDEALNYRPASSPRSAAAPSDSTIAPSYAPGDEEELGYIPGPRPGLRRVRPQKSARRGRKHPLFYIVATTCVFVGYWLLGTLGASWWTTAFSDPGYGPTRGTIITGVFGGGDSAAEPTKIIAINNDGKVQLVVIAANNPATARFISGPDLVAQDFPNPKQAVIDLQVIPATNGREDVKVIVWSDKYLSPFQRYSVVFVLTGDGHGGFQQIQPQK